MNLAARLERLEAQLVKPEERSIDLLSGAFAQQRAFIEDKAHLKWAFCTRRAAKSYSVGLEHIDSAVKYGGKHLYIGLTRESARAIMWEDVLKDIDTKYRVGLKFNETRLEARTANGGTIRLLGMDSNEDEKRKALGQKYRKIAIDEAQDFKIDLRDLVYGILKPSVADYRGSISLSGTPSNLIKGLFFDLTNGKEPGWSGHTWNTFDNPYMAARWKEEIDGLIAGNPLIAETPRFKQMYLGQWVIETDQLVYRFNPERNLFAELPTHKRGEWRYVLGVDLGFEDATAFVVCAYHRYDKTLYMLEASKESKLDITDVANRIKLYAQRFDFDAMIVDGANKQAVEEIRKRHDLPLKAADKTGKPDFIGVMNGELIQGKIKLQTDLCSDLVTEYQGLIWDKRAAKRVEHPNCPNHLCDAALYAWRYCYQYLSEAAPIPKAPEDEMEDAAEERLREALAASGLETEGVGDSSSWEWSTQ